MEAQALATAEMVLVVPAVGALAAPLGVERVIDTVVKGAVTQVAIQVV